MWKRAVAFVFVCACGSSSAAPAPAPSPPDDAGPAPDAPPADWTIDIGADAAALSPALLGHYDLSGSLYQYGTVPGLRDAMAKVGFAEWRVGVGRWEAATRMLPTTTNGAACSFPIAGAFA